MEVVLRFETRELERVKEKTFYNSVCHKFSRTQLGMTHLYEIYDDVSDFPRYELGNFDSSGFNSQLFGEGDPIPEGKEDCGGVWVEITLSRPDLSLTIK